MQKLTDLEREAIGAIIADNPEYQAVLTLQFHSAVVESRTNSGGGFYTALSMPASVPSVVLPGGPLRTKTYASVAGLEYGLGFLLFFTNGQMDLLEGHSIGVEDTSNLNLERPEFALVQYAP